MWHRKCQLQVLWVFSGFRQGVCWSMVFCPLGVGCVEILELRINREFEGGFDEIWCQWCRIIFANTPQKSEIDTKNGHSLKELTFSKPSFWVSILVFGDVVSDETIGSTERSVQHCGLIKIRRAPVDLTFLISNCIIWSRNVFLWWLCSFGRNSSPFHRGRGVVGLPSFSKGFQNSRHRYHGCSVFRDVTRGVFWKKGSFFVLLMENHQVSGNFNLSKNFPTYPWNMTPRHRTNSSCFGIPIILGVGACGIAKQRYVGVLWNFGERSSLRCMILLMEEIPNNYLGCIKPCK